MTKFLVGGIAAIALVLSLQGFAAAETMPSMPATCDQMVCDCTMMTDHPSISSLEQCVEHARAQGYIDNQGVAQSLLAEVSVAQNVSDLGKTQATISTLQSFIHDVEAQSGIHIDATDAQCLEMHANMVIQALQQ